MTRITCPSCGNRFTATDDAIDYDWESGVYLGGVRELTCPYCRRDLVVYGQATVDIEGVDVADD